MMQWIKCINPECDNSIGVSDEVPEGHEIDCAKCGRKFKIINEKTPDYRVYRSVEEELYNLIVSYIKDTPDGNIKEYILRNLENDE